MVFTNILNNMEHCVVSVQHCSFLLNYSV